MFFGTNYLTYCGAIGTSPAQTVGSNWVSSFQECIVSCTATSTCNAVMFREAAPKDGTYYCVRYGRLGWPSGENGSPVEDEGLGLDWVGVYDVAFKIDTPGTMMPR